MTAAPLHPTPPVVALERVQAAVDSLGDPHAVPPEAGPGVVTQVARIEAQLAAFKLGVIRRMDQAGVAKASGATSTGALIAGDFGGNRAAGDRLVRTAKNLESATLTQQALEAGQISLEQAEVVSRAVAGLPTELTDEDRGKVEARLISNAKMFSLPDLRRRVLRVAELYADKASADRDENEALRLQEARAWQNTELWFGQARDGLVAFGGKMPELHAAMLKNQVDAISAPRRHGLADGFQDTSDATSTTDDELTFSQRLGRAFCHWIERIPTDKLPTTGGTPATVTVNLNFDDLKSQLAAATLSNGTRISAGEVRRLACNAGILPRVLNSKSETLDQGRIKRLYTPAQRLAMADRDRGCTYPGCDRPPGWTEAHHLDWWAADGGNTDLNRGALLCARHHHWIHQHNIHGRLHNGHTQWHINGIWHTNHRWRP